MSNKQGNTSTIFINKNVKSGIINNYWNSIAVHQSWPTEVFNKCRITVHYWWLWGIILKINSLCPPGGGQRELFKIIILLSVSGGYWVVDIRN